MKDSTPPCLIAVDGRGTSCRVAVLCGGNRTDFATGSANVATDRTAAIKTIDDALAEVAARAGIPLPDLRRCPAYPGLAGVMSRAEGTAVAAELLQNGASYIANALRVLGWEPGETLCLTGGMGPQYQSHLPPEMAASVTPPKGSGLDGALAMAAQIAGRITEAHP